MDKQIQFKGIDDRGQVVCMPLLFDRGLEKTAFMDVRSKLHPRVQDFVRAVRPTPAGIYVLVNALGAGEYWGSNVNGDLFPEKALINAPPDWENLLANPERAREVGKAWPYGYPTFMDAYPYKHHVNKDPSRAFGRVELATWNPEMHRVELVVYLDRALCMQFDAMDIIQRVENGEFPDVSMGCKVPYDTCTICENPSKTRADYCEHALTMMNKILPDGRKVAVRNDHPKFFDISFVFIGADKTAKVMAKLAQKGNQVCMGDFCTMPRLSAEVGEVFSKTADPVDELIPNIGYTKEKAIEENRTTAKVSPFVSRWAPGVGASASEKTASLHRLRSAAAGAAIGGVGSAGGTHLFDRLKGEGDKQKMKDEAGRDFLAGAVSGGLAGALVKRANDPIKKKIRIQGIPVWLEWLKGETRQYKKGGVVKYERHMEADYGYIPGTLDSDGEELDVYVGPDKGAKKAFVIRQLKKTGGFDEHKIMLGYSSKAAAKASYVHHMGGTPERFGGMASVPTSSLIALFADNKATKEKTAACSCHGVGDDCGGSTDKLASLLFPISKSASHAKLSEIIKSIPAGPFSKETLPKLEKAERNIPNDVLDLMGGMPLGNALSTPTMAGMVLKPQEFQRLLLVSIGEKPYADELDSKNMTFERTKDVDNSIQLNEGQVDDNLMALLSALGLVRDRSAAGPALQRRAVAASADKPFQSINPDTQATKDPLMKKIAAAYNGYRMSLLKKAASISNYMTNDSQLRAELFGSSMAEAFAGGVAKVASSASALSPDSLAYLVGAYNDRDMLLTDEVVASLALTGTVTETA